MISEAVCLLARRQVSLSTAVWSLIHVFHLFSVAGEPGAKVSTQRQETPRETIHSEQRSSTAQCTSPPLFCADHSGIRRSGLTLVKSPGSSDHYLFLARRKPKAHSNCIINIIAVGEPIILCLSVFTCPNLELGRHVDERGLENLSNCSSQLCGFELFCSSAGVFVCLHERPCVVLSSGEIWLLSVIVFRQNICLFWAE